MMHTIKIPEGHILKIVHIEHGDVQVTLEQLREYPRCASVTLEMFVWEDMQEIVDKLYERL